MVRKIATFIQDTILFLMGVGVILKQAGIYFDPPANGPEIELIILGGLLCNGPIMLQALALRGGSPPRTEPPASGSPSAPSSGSSGGS